MEGADVSNLIWGVVLEDLDFALMTADPDAPRALGEPVADVVRKRFGLDMNNVFMLNNLLRAFGMQGRALAANAARDRSVSRSAIVMPAESSQRLSQLVTGTWCGFILELDRSHLAALMQESRRSMFRRMRRSPAPDPRGLNWPSVAPTPEETARTEAALELDEPLPPGLLAMMDQAIAQLSSTFADGLFAFSCLSATRLIVEAVLAGLAPNDGVPTRAAEHWSDMVLHANFRSLPFTWKELI